VETLVEIGPIMTALIGLMLPLAGLVMFALSSEVEIRSARRPRKPLLVSSAYGALCLLSVPIVVVALAAVFPSLTARFSGLAEAAIVLLFVSVGATILTAREMKLE
jgi:drug/metabolite transporter (DMT)-like permease